MKKIFQCENKECKHQDLKENNTKDGILLGCLCSECGWHMVDIEFEKS